MRTRNPQEVANSIRMRRQQHSGTFLVVEGRADRLFFEKFVHQEQCVVIAAGGREPVAEIVSTLVSSGFEGILGVVDGDSARIGVTPSDNLLLLDDPDLEMMLIQSTALDNVLLEFGSSGKLAKLQDDVRDLLIQAAIPIGCFRSLSLDMGLSLTFEGIRYPKFINLQSLELDRHALVHEVKRRSQQANSECGPVLAAIMSAEAGVISAWSICCGDDIVSILGLGLRKLFGSKRAGEVSYDTLVRSLRLAYSESEFRGTRICQTLLDWANRNQKFVVLRVG
ncbi:MAG: DUF4435 domain-containing protein [Gammaproteobacteria bacterium]|nr:DUF4435 domain-containing protein [Gammaproteobacteria bacterium]